MYVIATMETGSTNEVHFCDKCHNLSYLHLWKPDEDSEETLVYYCKACGNKEDVSQDSRCMYTLNFGEYDKSEYLNTNKYITTIHDPKHRRFENIVSGGVCVRKENRSSSVNTSSMIQKIYIFTSVTIAAKWKIINSKFDRWFKYFSSL